MIPSVFKEYGAFTFKDTGVGEASLSKNTAP
jgi:hypothetical protein